MKEIKHIAKYSINDFEIYVKSIHSNFYVVHIVVNEEPEVSAIWLRKEVEGLPTAEQLEEEVLTQFKRLRGIE